MMRMVLALFIALLLVVPVAAHEKTLVLSPSSEEFSQRQSDSGSPNKQFLALAVEEERFPLDSEALSDFFEELEERVRKKTKELRRELLSDELDELIDELFERYADAQLSSGERERLVERIRRAWESENEKVEEHRAGVAKWFARIKESEWVQEASRLLREMWENLNRRIRGNDGMERA